MSRAVRPVVAAAIALVVVRSFVFLWWEQSAFDSDQAIIGLMALHISELRAFPIFMYGFNYLLAVEAYLAAPVFAVFGPSVATLRLPLVAVNAAVAVLLIVLLTREVKLRPALAFVASLFFLLPAPGTASQLVEASGGNPEPFLYILLLWITWNRPLLFGAVLGFGFLHREFTAYGLVALLLLELAAGTLLTRRGVWTLARAAVSCACVLGFVYALRPWSDAAGPGAGPEFIVGPASNLQTLGQRFCWTSPGAVLIGLRELVARYLALPFGAAPQALTQFGINSTLSQGLPGLWTVLVAMLLVSVMRVGWRCAATQERPWLGDLRFCSYLLLVGLQSAVFYVVTRCGELSVLNMRYTLLSLFAGVGVAAAFLRVETSRPLRAAAIAILALSATTAGVHHVRLIAEYVGHTPPNYRRPVADYLIAKGIKYARSDYWTAYHVTFFAGERVVVSSDSSPRILEYEWSVDAHRVESVRISRTPCPGGVAIIPDVYYACR